MLRRTFLSTVAAAGGFLAARTIGLAQSASGTPASTTGGDEMTTTDAAPRTGYAPVNGLNMYYEIHGENQTGTPVLLLHGAFQSTGTLGPILPGLAATRQVIILDLQGHGRTADVDRPLTYEGMADDCAALLRHLGVAQADVVGFSMGGPTAIQIAIRHPEVVRTLVPISAAFRLDGWQPELLAMAPTMSPEMFAGSPFEVTYKEIAPDPEDFPILVEKIKAIDTTPFDWQADFPGIAVPTLIVVGDADVTRPEHAVEMLRLLGGGAMGDMAGIPKVRLAVLPGTTHFIPPGYGVMDRHEWFLPMITAFLDAPEPVPGMAEGAP